MPQKRLTTLSRILQRNATDAETHLWATSATVSY